MHHALFKARLCEQSNTAPSRIVASIESRHQRVTVQNDLAHSSLSRQKRLIQTHKRWKIQLLDNCDQLSTVRNKSAQIKQNKRKTLRTQQTRFCRGTLGLTTPDRWRRKIARISVWRSSITRNRDITTLTTRRLRRYPLASKPSRPTARQSCMRTSPSSCAKPRRYVQRPHSTGGGPVLHRLGSREQRMKRERRVAASSILRTKRCATSCPLWEHQIGELAAETAMGIVETLHEGIGPVDRDLTEILALLELHGRGATCRLQLPVD